MADYENGIGCDNPQRPLYDNPPDIDRYYGHNLSAVPQHQYYTQAPHQQQQLGSVDAFATQYGHERAYSDGSQPNYLQSPPSQLSPSKLYHNLPIRLEDGLVERQQQSSPTPQQNHFQSQYTSPPQTLHHAHGLGLGSIEASPASAYQTFLPPMNTSTPVPNGSGNYYGLSSQQQQTPHAASTASPPSLAGSRRQSLSDNGAYPTHTYTSPSTSAVPSGLTLLNGKASFDSSTSGSRPSSSGFGRPASMTQLGAGYPISVSAQGIMTVYAAHPMFGPMGTSVNVNIGVASHDPHTIRGFRVMFGHHGTTTKVIGERRVPDGERVDLCAATPPVHLTNRYPGTSVSVPLLLQALDEAGNVADWAEIGSFTYTDSPTPGGYRTHKRPGSPLSSSRASPITPSRATFPDLGSPSMDGRNGHQRGHSRNSSIGSLVNGFGGLNHHSRNSSLASLNEQEAHWVSTADGELVERKPIARLRAPTTVPTSTPSSSALRHPPTAPVANLVPPPCLYRTSQIPGASEAGSPASSIVDKASLRFEGNMDLMALGWSHEEWLIKRRLVQFSRRQEGQNIIARFRPTSLQELTPDSIVISCIFREDKNECFVTSVDTIYLLEALVAVRFTVEEKNRIRRNLEGFKPITVSKGKEDAEPFFKLIMGFPHPKPRNIEKDVKVFPWKTLGPSLRKIVSKYSATYVSASELAQPGRPPPQPIGWAPGQEPISSGHQEEDGPGVNREGAEIDNGERGTLLPPQQHPGAPSLATVPEHP